MADFGIAHLSIGQADGLPGGLDQGVRIAREVGIQVRRIRQRDTVVALARVGAEPVQDH